MSEKRFSVRLRSECDGVVYSFFDGDNPLDLDNIVDLLNEQQELIEELHISDHMGWGRAEKFEKELKQKKIYIKRLEYKVQKFKEMNSEQQATINKLKSDIEETEISIKLFEDDVNRLSKENEQLEKDCIALIDDKKRLQDENGELRQELQKKQEEEQLYANEIVKLNKEAKEVLNFKKLGGDY